MSNDSNALIEPEDRPPSRVEPKATVAKPEKPARTPKGAQKK